MPDQDRDRRKSLGKDLTDLTLANMMDDFEKTITLATTEYQVNPVSKATENAVQQPDVDVRRDLAGTRQTLSKATRTIGDLKRYSGQLEVVNATLGNSALSQADNIGFAVDVGVANYINLGVRLDQETMKIGKQDRSGLFLKVLPWIVITVLGLPAIVELSRPALLLPFTSWLQPSSANCQNSVVSGNPGANSTAIQSLVSKCTSGVFYVGLEHILAVALVVGIPLAIIGSVLAKRRKKTKTVSGVM